MHTTTRSPQLGVDYHHRAEGGLLGAMQRAKDRKRAKLAQDRQQAVPGQGSGGAGQTQVWPWAWGCPPPRTHSRDVQPGVG